MAGEPTTIHAAVAQVFSETRCTLGEGPLWHPTRRQLFWFDILEKRLLSVAGGKEIIWQFDDCVSAAGWVDETTLIMASARALWRFDIESGARTHLIDLEADQPLTRSNDGRADPWGGFWIGTMGYNAEFGLGAIYRYYRGELRQLVASQTITNAICFAPDKSFAYFADTKTGKIMRQPLAAEDGWPIGAPSVFIDLSGEDFGPDGAIVDAEGRFWNAQWGASRVAIYTPTGELTEIYSVPTAQASCPALGGESLSYLFITTAADGLDDPAAGKTYSIQTTAKGQREHRVIL
ncbi:SMP-30/gluconolactonase/LRE family protein [Phaeobacter sp. HS012]|uniref:SMP-30/gluconolactonase/LRE family protein n=1 Tax=unclassified Phaeobacter TaxID=2621772 RepID=UPI001B38F97F|nr:MULTISPECIES: SMP-30/gluconolactonase/LRE family protein [unclassified Phaeobacter]MBQ4805884.1 SMP-30/gluconolactonase/LRE family protein [Phaeobacter sp. HS012]MBQ4880734.1 SMP-30/gluconolactonase/LRE family protein [Phaeobacter sp. HS011]